MTETPIDSYDDEIRAQKELMLHVEGVG